MVLAKIALVVTLLVTSAAVGQVSRVYFSDGQEIFRIEEGGSSEQLTTSGGGAEINPVCSPDGRRVVFQRMVGGSWDIVAMDADGDDATPLTSGGDNDTNPSWTANGLQVVFSRGPTGATQLFVVDDDPTDTPEALPTPGAASADHPSIFPQGFFHIRPHKGIHFLHGIAGSSPKRDLNIQLSMKTRIRRIPRAYFAYTVSGFAGGFNFREYNHNPEFFWDNHWRGHTIRLGVWEHESDGVDGVDIVGVSI